MLIINIILPVFSLILIGWVLARLNFVDTDTSKGLMRFLYYGSGPAIIFYAISSYTLPQIFDLTFWVVYPSIMIGVTTIAFLIYKYTLSESNIKAITTAYATTVKNTVIIGFPLLMGIIGNQAAIPMAITVIFFNCIMLPILVLILEIHLSTATNKHKLSLLYHSIISTLKNPLVFGSVAGIFCAWTKVTIPIAISKILTYLSGSFLPCALFSVGIDLSALKRHHHLSKTLAVVGLNLIVTPLISIAICYYLNLTPIQSLSIVLFSAVPTAQIMYVYVSRYKTLEKDVAAIVASTTFFSIFTIPAIIYFCYLIWPGVFVLKITS